MIIGRVLCKKGTIVEKYVSAFPGQWFMFDLDPKIVPMKAFKYIIFIVPSKKSPVTISSEKDCHLRSFPCKM